MSHEDVTARGIALADDLVAAALVFGGLLCVCAAVFVLSNHEVVYEKGCTPICATMGVYSVLVFTAAFVVQIASYARMEDLDVLFNDASCGGDINVCSQAFRARRFYAANGSPAVLWACAAGLTLFAFPYDRRCRSRRDYFSGVEDPTGRKAATASAWAAIFSALVALGAVFLFSDSASFLASVEVLLLYFSIPLAWYGESWLACGLHAGGIAVYTATRLGGPLGYDLAYLTHWFVAATLLVTVILAVTTGISLLLYNSWCSQGRYIEWIEVTTAILLVVLVSLQLLLTIASLSLGSGYDGARIGDGRTWRQTSFEWATQHNVSFFFAAALVGGRFETQNPTIGRGMLRAAWFSIPVLLVALWTAARWSFSRATFRISPRGNPCPWPLPALQPRFRGWSWALYSVRRCLCFYVAPTRLPAYPPTRAYASETQALVTTIRRVSAPPCVFTHVSCGGCAHHSHQGTSASPPSRLSLAHNHDAIRQGRPLHRRRSRRDQGQGARTGARGRQGRQQDGPHRQPRRYQARGGPRDQDGQQRRQVRRAQV